MSGATTRASQKFLVKPSPKMSESPIASNTNTIPSTRPVKTCAASADRERSITTSSEPLLGAGAVQFLVGRHPAHHLDQPPVALRLVTTLDDPEVLEGLVVAGAPPLLALVVVVDRVGAQRLGHGQGAARQPC